MRESYPHSLSAKLKPDKQEWRCVKENWFCRLMFSYTTDTPLHTIADNVRLLIEEIHEMFKRICEE